MLCDTCKLEPFCNWEIPEYVESFDVTKCSRYSDKPLRLPKGGKKMVKVLVDWLDKECSIDCDNCAIQDICDVFANDPAFKSNALDTIMEIE
jgi:hypothetical protein